MERLLSLAFALVVAVSPFGALNNIQVEGAEILQQVPRDALGLLVARNLAELDDEAGQVLRAFGSGLPGPLDLLKSIAGIQAGLDERRDLMIVLLPSPGDASLFSLALWLPVADYEALVHSLDGDPGRRIAAVTLAGEDLLVVRQDDWAVIMDPDQRDRLEQLSESQPAPPRQVQDWENWSAASDATIIVLPSGMKALLDLAGREKLFEPLPATAPLPPGTDLFGSGNRPAPPPGGWPAIRHWIRSTIADRPELARWATEARGAACDLRLDNEGNVALSLKLAFDESALPTNSNTGNANRDTAAPRLYSSGDFVVTGGGRVAPDWVVPVVAPYVRQVANDLRNNYGIPIDEQDVAKFRSGVERAIAEVQAFTVLTRPGTGEEAVFTNSFLALRVTSANRFLDIVAECVKLWNEMLDVPQASMQLVFKSKEIALGGRSGTEYSIDMAAAVNAPAIPEARASMEKLFGPGALFRLQMVALDDTTVLLAAATEEQVVEVIQAMNAAPDRSTEPAELLPAKELLSSNAAWQIFVSPSGYTTWLKRQMDAVLGAVIGGPIVPQIAASPPLGVAGGVDGRVISIEVAAPIETLRSLGQHWRH